jgi:hypothetical protein
LITRLHDVGSIRRSTVSGSGVASIPSKYSLSTASEAEA